MKSKTHLTDSQAADAATKQAAPKKAKPQVVRLDDLKLKPDGHITVTDSTAKTPGKIEEEDFDYVPVTVVEAVNPEKIEENAGKIEEGVARAATDLFESSQRIEAARATGNGRKLQIATEAEAPKITAAKAYIDKQLNRVGALLTAAATAFLNATLSMPYKKAGELKAMLHMLVARKLLILTQTWDGDTVRIGYQRYRLGDFGFMPSDVAAITAKANQLSHLSDKLEGKRREEHVKAMGTGSISLAQAIAGASGTVVITVPTEYSLVGPEGAKKERRRSGGTLALEFGERYVVPVDGDGGFKNMIEGMIEREAKVTRDFLKVTEDQLQQRKSGITQSLQTNQRMSYPDARAKADDMLTIWWKHPSHWQMNIRQWVTLRNWIQSPSSASTATPRNRSSRSPACSNSTVSSVMATSPAHSCLPNGSKIPTITRSSACWRSPLASRTPLGSSSIKHSLPQLCAARRTAWDGSSIKWPGRPKWPRTSQRRIRKTLKNNT